MAVGKKNPETDASEEQAMQDADERAAQEVREVAASKDEPDDGGGEPEYDFGGEDDEPEERPSRQERRQNRYREAMERAERAEQAARRAEQMIQQMREPPPVPPQQQLQEHLQRFEDDYSRNQQEQLSLSEFYALREQQTGGKMPDEEKQRFLARSRELQLQASEIAVRRAQMLQQPQQPRQQDPYAAYLQAEYADVTSSPSKKAYANFLYREGLERGDPDGPQLLKRVLEDARKHFAGNGGGQRNGARKPTANTQARFAGNGAGGGGGARGGEQNGGAAKRGELPAGLSLKEFRRMADAMYPHIKDEKKRYDHHYKTNVLPEMKKSG